MVCCKEGDTSEVCQSADCVSKVEQQNQEEAHLKELNLHTEANDKFKVFPQLFQCKKMFPNPCAEYKVQLPPINFLLNTDKI